MEMMMGLLSVKPPVLIAQAGPLNGTRWTIGDSMLIGRDESCDIIIPDRQISRFHIRITKESDSIILEDLGSKNGTFINTIQVTEPVKLHDGDDFSVAYIQQFVYLCSDSTLPLEPGSLPSSDKRGKLFVDSRSRRVWIVDKEVLPPLSVPQFRMLQLLFNQPGKVISRQDLVLAIWGEKEAIGISEQALDALIRRLRERLHSIDSKHQYIITIRGHGVRLDNPDS